MRKGLSFFVALLVLFSLSSCVTTRGNVLGTPQTQVQMRNYQSRSFETKDQAMVLRAVIATLQDLGFIVEKADKDLGIVSGTSFTNGSKITASVRAVGKKTVVRVNAESGYSPITNPMAYQNFFNSLSQSLFLEAHEVE